MLNAGVFDEFKGATTLLLWGDVEGMAALFAGLSALREGTRNELVIDETDTRLTVCSASRRTEWSTLRKEEGGFRWECSHDTIELAADLVEPLLRGAGHQFLDVTGLARQVIIARDEYPADLR
jgi:hypothetical protein